MSLDGQGVTINVTGGIPTGGTTGQALKKASNTDLDATWQDDTVTVLADGKIVVGNGSNVGTAVTPSGDVTMTNAGVTAIGAAKVTEAMQVLADNTTNDVSTTKHGYAPKVPNDATKYLDGTGAYSVPVGSGGLSQGAINQLFAASPSVYCDPGGANAGAITVTVVNTAGNNVLTCSADCRAYIKGPYTTVGTAAQAGKAALVQSVSADGLTITCAGISEDNPLATDAVASQLKVYGAPVQIYGNTGQSVTSSIWSTNEGTVHIQGNAYWTGPMFSAGSWTQFGGTISGYIINGADYNRITGLTAHALVVAGIGGTINSNITAVGNVDAGEDDLMTYTVPASMLETNGDRLDFLMAFTCAANANNKEIKVKYGATTLFDTGVVAANGSNVVISGTITRTAAATQIAAAWVSSTNATIHAIGASVTTPGETLSGTVILKATGEATATNDIQQVLMTVDYCPAP